MKREKKRRNRGFLETYSLADRYLSRSDAARGRPGLIEGRAPDGTNVLIKIWPRKGIQDDADLAEIWRHELRQLLRLMGHPGAGDRIATLYATDLDDNAFYLVLDSGQKRPLHTVLETISAAHWLKSPRSAASRLRVWMNFSRVATALDILHSQGLLHRNIDNWAILTAGSEDPDFQLTGFEWSMRLASGESVTSRRSNVSTPFDSFQADWTALGELFAALLGVDSKRIRDLELTPAQVADHLDSSETRLLRQIVGVDPVDSLDGDYIGAKIAEVTSRLESIVAKHEASYRLVVRLGAKSKLSEEIRKASDREIEISDTERQLSFIRDDLSTQALLVATRVPGTADAHRYVLRGHQLNYRVEPYRHPNQPNPNWDFAYCEYVEPHAPASRGVLGKAIQLSPDSVQILTIGEAADSYTRVRRRVASWDGLRGKVTEDEDENTEEQAKLRSLALSQLVEMAFAVSDIFPVRIISRPGSAGALEGAGAEGTSYTIQVEVRADQERDALAKALKLKKTGASRLEELTERGDGSVWTLADTAMLGDRSIGESEWSFAKIIKSGNHPHIYVFQWKEPAPTIKDVYLIPATSVGVIAQFKRRVKALEALSEHFELLRTLADPRARLFESRESVDESDAFFLALDVAKRGALTELTSVLPMYLVQGPPGVGKTRLVREVVRRRFQMEPTARLLLTAQSHAAVDHLMSEIRSSIGGTEGAQGPLIVRCKKKDDVGATSPWDIREQTKMLVVTLAQSELVQHGTASVQAQIRDMANTEDTSSQPARTAFEGVVMRAANIVFATTNSGELERLIDERGQFDWTIVEEAGKATGSELVSPLLLSHRRLMIGDHKQLPPYRSDEMRQILESEEDLAEVVRIAPTLISRSLRGGAVGELLEDWKDETADDVGNAAVESLLMFEAMIENEFERQAKSDAGRNIATKLTVQHRMHPDIAELVSRVFYKNALRTDEDRASSFATGQLPYEIESESKLPRTPIALIDMPDLQSTRNQKSAERLRRWWNEDELSAVVNVLESLRGRRDTMTTTLAVLSPYAEQVRRLERRIEQERSGRLRHIDGFSPATSGGFCSTVDSFQGSEADVVIISMVRNNQFTRPGQALGFLQDARRMNVLLSRAKWKMVLVGSFGFLRSVTSAIPHDPHGRLEFLKDLMDHLDQGVRSGRIGRIAYSDLQAGCKP